MGDLPLDCYDYQNGAKTITSLHCRGFILDYKGTINDSTHLSPSLADQSSLTQILQVKLFQDLCVGVVHRMLIFRLFLWFQICSFNDENIASLYLFQHFWWEPIDWRHDHFEDMKVSGFPKHSTVFLALSFPAQLCRGACKAKMEQSSGFDYTTKKCDTLFLNFASI